MAKEKSASEKHKLPLSKPIKAHADEVTVLEFRAPNGEDLLEVGSAPFLLDSKERIHIDFAVTGDYIVRLAGIPLSSVKQMEPIDIFAAFGVIAGFFGASGMIQKKLSADTSS